MYLYHIDRYGYIKEGQTINLIQPQNPNPFFNKLRLKHYKNGLSFSGLNYLLAPDIFNVDMRMRQTIFEIIFEQVRYRSFKRRPSRFQSFFGCDESGLQEWMNIFLSYEDATYPIYKIDAKNVFKADSRFVSDIVYGLPGMTPDNSVLSVSQIDYQATFYWRGRSTANPLFEYLIKPPFRVLDRIV